MCLPIGGNSQLNSIGGRLDGLHVPVVLLDGVDIGATARVVIEWLLFSEPPVAVAEEDELGPPVLLEQYL